MSGNFRDFYARSNNPFVEDDGSYRAWEPCQQGSALTLKLVPSIQTGEPVRRIPYLQPITIEHHRETDQLCLICPASNMVVFIEGHGLEELADLIAEKSVRTIHVYDHTHHPEPDNQRPIVRSLTVQAGINTES